MYKQNKLSVFLTFFGWALWSATSLSAQCNRASDSLELVKLYKATDGENWEKKWDLLKPMNTWYGVRLNNQGCVEQLQVSSNGLKGSLPDFNLPNLVYLNLHSNQLSGIIPNFNLPNLQDLWLWENQLTGTIPNFNLPYLQQLKLENNQLSGCIPKELKINCPYIIVEYSSISNNPNLATQNWKNYWEKGEGACGTVPKNSAVDTNTCRYQDSIELVKLYKATDGENWEKKWDLPQPMNTWYGISVNQQGCVDSIKLINNKLSGTIPNFNLPNLKTMALWSNELTGTIPNFNLPNLQKLSLSYNQLTGTIPNFDMPNLQELSLGFNKLTGTIPNFNLPNLQKLNLGDDHSLVGGNQLTGTIPNFNLPKLQDLRLEANQLTGAIPNFNLPNLENLDLGRNRLTGTIPNFNLPKLEYLEFGGNRLTGTIPNFNLPNLQGLLLYGNQLTGTIPNLNLPKLQRLIIGDNSLTGTISNFNLPNLQDLQLDDNQLTGSIPNFNLPILQQLYLKNNLLNGCIPPELKINCPLLKDGDISNNPNLATQDWKSYWEKGEGACGVANSPVVDINTCRYQDSLELVKLYKATDGENWERKWDLTQPMNTWYGISINVQGCVDSIKLINHKLSGTIPNFNLPNLRYLDLSDNKLVGSIPNFNLPNLRVLYFLANQFTGSIPNFNLPNLEALVLSDNQFTGSIPNFNLPNLQTLSLDGNKLIGTIPNFNMANLLELYLQYNQFTGSIPNFNLSNLQALYLEGNELTGTIPNFNLPNLQALSLTNNQLTGTIPNFNLPNLQDLVLSANKLSGSIPNFNLPNLQDLYLTDNQLTGTILNFNLPNLQNLSLTNNQLTGTIPNFNLPKLKYLRLANNLLNGCIPPELKTNCPLLDMEYCYISNNPNLTTQDWKNYWEKGEGACGVANSVVDTNTCRYRDSTALVNLYRATDGSNWFNTWDLIKPMDTWHNVVLNEEGCVKSLSLINNGLSGTIPNLTLPNLESLFLDNNQLNGTIPNFDLPNLRALHLSFNQLSGTIPDLDMPNLQELWLNNNQLTGTVPSFKLAKLRSLRLSFNQLSGTLPPTHPQDLEELWLDNNQLSGAIGTLNLPNLEVLHLEVNQLSDTLSNFDLPNLRILALNHNRFSGTIPNFDLPNLQILSLYYNRLSGIIPNFKLPNLESLLLSNNQLSGTLPNFELPKLRQLHLGFNLLSGIIPSLVMANLKSLSLSGNRLSGSIPNFDLPNLQSLYLYDNQLTGSIPSFDLPELKELALNDNELSGTVPTVNLPNLETVFLDNNRVSGSIPTRTKQIVGFRFNASTHRHSRIYKKLEDAPISRSPLSVSLRPFCPMPGVQNVGEGSCTFWASIHGVMSIQHAIHRKTTNPQDISKITFSKSYAFNQLVDSINQPVAPHDILTFLNEKGTCYATTFRNEIPLDQKPDSLAIKEAFNYTLDSFRYANNDTSESIEARIFSLKRLLANSTPVLIVLGQHRDFEFITDKPWRLIDEAAIQHDTSHAMCLIGYNDLDSTFEVMNSRGCEWGDKGFAKIHYTDMFSLLNTYYVLYPKFEKPQTMTEIVLRQPKTYTDDKICVPSQFSEVRVKFDAEKNLYKTVKEQWRVGAAFQMVLRKVPVGWFVYSFSMNSKGESDDFYEVKGSDNSIDKVLPSDNDKFEVVSDSPEYLCILLSKTPLSNFKNKIKAIQQPDQLMGGLTKAFSIKKAPMIADRMGVLTTKETPKIIACVLQVN